jgi:hypothetical protein
MYKYVRTVLQIWEKSFNKIRKKRRGNHTTPIASRIHLNSPGQVDCLILYRVGRNSTIMGRSCGGETRRQLTLANESAGIVYKSMLRQWKKLCSIDISK